jgi:beta-hydroxylase
LNQPAVRGFTDWKIPFVGKSLFQIAKNIRPAFDRLIMRFSLIPDAAIQDKAAFPWIAGLEARWEDIRAEALAIRTAEIPSLGEISGEHARIAADRRWKTLFLMGYGYRMESNTRRAPVTAALLDRIPGLVSANFSVLEAGGHIPRHMGVTKAMLTYHLALKSPAQREPCRMHVEEGETTHVLHWQDGQSFVFDDHFYHEVWNGSEEDRYILLIQIKRPCSWLGNAIQDFFLWAVRRSRFVQEIRESIEAAGGEVRLRGRRAPISQQA